MKHPITSINVFYPRLYVVIMRTHATRRYYKPTESSLKRLAVLVNRLTSYSFHPRGTLYVYHDGWKWDHLPFLAQL